MRKIFLLILVLAAGLVYGQSSPKFNGWDMSLGNLSRLSDAKTRSISPENYTGARGGGAHADPRADSGKRNVANAWAPARDLGKGWKVNPFIEVAPGETFTVAEMEGPGAIQHIWMTPTGNWRFSILRFYWDEEKTPSIEVPVGDFFGMGLNEYAPLNSLAVTVNPGSAFNCYWKMPFRKKARITLENLDNHPMRLYYQVDYALGEVGADEAYFHAQFRRSNPTQGALHTLLDGVKGKGQYVGTYLAWNVNNNAWWGEGEIKFYLDGDRDYPTINGTGTEDYFCGSYNFENKRTHQYEPFSTAYAGLHQVIKPDGLYLSQMAFGMYRWHIMDPIRFEKDLKVTIQDLGWRHDGRYYPQKSDISSTVFWYQQEPHAPFPVLPSKDDLEIPKW
ncbi:MAG: glycoside hydrolase family 172 protein [Flavisolibacter sp.]